MRPHGVSGILTFNKKDFIRFDELQVIHPAEVRA
jgi:hypothetical protein